jgi:DNA-binding winged helix-turn-helix (wHTH) protein/tetratricopeptide (TPR) repeat protein
MDRIPLRHVPALMADISFGPFTIDPSSNRLLRDGVEVRMRPQAFEALRTLATYGGRPVDYDQLISEAWRGTTVSRHTVDVTIAEIRKILRDCGTWIQRQPRSGYVLRIPKSETFIGLGWHFLNQRSRDGFERALECFEHAAAEAPRDSRAYEGQSACYLMLASFGIRAGRDMFPRFLEAHQRAVALIGLTPELRCNYAHAVHLYRRELDEAEAGLRQTLAERPNLAPCHVRLTLLHVTKGDLDAALESVGHARTADPLLPLTAATEVSVRLWRREFDLAVSLGAQAIQLHPYLLLARAFYGIALEMSDRLDEALEQYRIGAVLSQGLSWIRALEGVCLIKLGRHRDGRAILKDLLALRRREYVDSYGVARLLLALGDSDGAFAELERAVDESVGGLYALKVDPLADSFRSDRRFSRLLRRYLTPIRR